MSRDGTSDGSRTGTFGPPSGGFLAILILSMAVLSISIGILATGCGDQVEGADTSWDCGKTEGKIEATLSSDGTFVISGEGDMADYVLQKTPWYQSNSKIKKVIVEEGVTSIGNYSFEGCWNIGSVELPDSLRTIGANSFGNCKFTSIEIPDSVTSIGYGAFWACRPLTTIGLPSNLQTIGSYAFYYCGLTSVSIPDSVESMGSETFRSCNFLKTVKLPSKITSIEPSAFFDCSSLASIEIPDSVTWIGSAAFMACSSLQSVTFSDNITAIGSQAFDGCSSLKTIDLPEHLKDVGWYLFKGCTAVETVSFGYDIDYKSEDEMGGGAYVPDDLYTDLRLYVGDRAANSTADLAGYTFKKDLATGHLVRQAKPECTVGFDAAGGSGEVPASFKTEGGTLYEIPDIPLEKDGNSFGGWSFGGNVMRSGQKIRIVSDTTLVAVWIPVMHSVTYELDGGSGNAPLQDDVQEGATFHAAIYAGTKEASEFKGWKDKGGTAVYEPGSPVTMGAENMVLIAVWDPMMYEVVFDLNGGDGDFPPMRCPPGGGVALGTTEPVRDSYTFGGWSCDGATYPAGAVLTVDGDMTLKAEWTADAPPMLPVEEEFVEPRPEEGAEPWLGRDGTSILLIALVAAMIAELTVLCVSRRR